MKLIVGLGNPGRRYVNNRHNVGFRCLDYFARRQGITLNRRRARSKLGMGEVEDTRIVLAKPGTFMNLSGEAVAAVMRYYRLPVQDLLVLYDDLDLPLGKIRIRERGGSGGHKGVESVISCLGSQDFPRIRVGIASQEDAADAFSGGVDTVEYVLSDFTGEEKPVIQQVYPEVADAIVCLIRDGVAAAMNKFN